MGNETKHRRLSQRLLADIANGKYGPGSRLPSETQLCEKYSISRPTVGRALRELQEQGLIERRVGSGSYVRSTPSSIPGSGIKQLGLLVPGLGKIEIFDVICGELAALARVHDYVMLWGGSGRPRAEIDMSIQEAEDIAEEFVKKGVAGVFFAPFEHTTDKDLANRSIVEKFRQAGIPVVLLDRDLGPFPQRSGFDLVGIDNYAGGFLLAEHLAKLGAKRTLFFRRPYSAGTVDARIAGATAALQARGAKTSDPFVHTGDPTDVAFVRGLQLGRQVDSVICANDHSAAQLMQTLSRLNVAVPKALRIVGFDDVRFATLLPIQLTTMHQPCRDIAVAAMHVMDERISEPTLPPRAVLLTPRLIVRESCGAYLH